MKSLVQWLSVCALGLLLAACGNREPLRIGFLAELSGPSADLGEAARNGVLLAIDQFRENKALNGRSIEVLVRDTGTDTQSAQKAAEELVRAKVDVIIGPTSSVMVDNILPVVEKSGVLLVTPTASAVKFHGKDDMLFRLNWTTRDNGRNYAAHYYKKGIRKISVAANENNRSFTGSWLKEFQTAFEELGGRIAATQYFDSSSANHVEVITALIEPQPDGLLLIANAADAARLAQQAHKLAPKLPMIAAEWAGTEQLIELGGKAVEGLMIVQNFNQDDDSARFQQFREAYLTRFRKNPVFGSVLSHDAASVTLTALSKRERGMTTKEALLKFGPYEGLQQAIQFDASGDTNRVAYFMVVRDSRFMRE